MTPSPGRAAVLAFCAGFAALTIWHYGDRLTDFQRGMLYLLAGVTASWALFDLLTLLVNVWDQHAYEVRLREAITPANELLRTMAALSENAQVEIAMHLGFTGIEWHLLPTNDGPRQVANVNGVSLPLQFVEHFFKASNSLHLQPIRSYSDGSRERGYAQVLTDWLVRFGYAVRARANMPATWTDGGFERAQVAFFGKE